MEVMTPFTKEKLKKELVHLENQVEQTLLMIGEAGDRSDWHDNFALDQANRDFDFYSQRRLIIKSILRRAKVIKPRREIDFVDLGNSLKLYFERGKRSKNVVLLGNLDAGRKPNWISIFSPLGRKLIGRKIGEKVRLKLNGKSQVVTIEAILPGDFN